MVYLYKVKKYLRKLGLGLSISAILFGIVAVIFPASRAGATSTLEEDIVRRNLHNLQLCLTAGSRDNSYIDVNRDYSNSNDPLGNQIDNENTVVGFDIDSQNGVHTCLEVITEGVNALYGANTITPNTAVDDQKDAVGAWLVKYLTGKTFGEDSTVRKKDSDAWKAKIEKLKTDARTKELSLGAPSDDVLQQRFAPLLSICYDMYAIGQAPKALSGDNGFQVDGVGVFFRKDNNDVFDQFIKPNSAQNGSKIYKPNDGFGTSTGIELGTIDLQHQWDSFADAIYGDDGSGDFYPMGSDIPGDLNFYRNSIAECETIELPAVKAFLFKNATVQNGVLVSSQGLPIGTPPVLDSTNGDPGSGDNTCESKSGAMGWILCPVINLIDGALNWVDSQVQALLEIDQNKYTNPTLKDAWRSIRNIAYIILIPLMLIMVIGTALGFEAFSAYTVKKALPRMVIAVIFITFSWEICTLLITFFNVIGGGILGLITQPFREQMKDLSCQNGNLNLSCLFSVESGINGSSIIHSILFIPTALASIVGLIIFLIFFGTTLLLAIGAAFLVLLARQMFIIALLLVAPLAILAWIFPGNDALWKGWWGTFSKLLIMFPLIMLIIGVGRIFALLLNVTSGGTLDGAILNPIMKLGAYMLPYAFIPFTFKFAGGLFGNLAGIVNDKNKGLFDRAKKSRAHKFERAKSGNYMRGGNKEGSFRSGVNKAFEVGLNANRAGMNPFRMKSQMQTALSNNKYLEAKEALEKNQDLAAIKGNDDFLEAGRVANDVVRKSDGTVFLNNRGKQVERDGSDKATRAYLEARGDNYNTEDINNAVAAIRNAKRGMSQDSYNVASSLGIISTGTGYSGGAGEMDKAIVEATGTDTLLASRLIAEGRGLASQARRPDLAGGGYGARLNAFKGMRNAMLDPNATEGSISSAATETTRIVDNDTLQSQSGGTIATMKKATLESRIAPMMYQDLKSTIDSGDSVKFLREIGAIEGRHDVMNQISPENAGVLADKVLSQQIDVSSLTPELQTLLATAIQEFTRDVNGDVTGTTSKQFITVQQAGEAVSGNDVYRQARKEFGSALAAQQSNRPTDADPGAITGINP